MKKLSFISAILPLFFLLPNAGATLTINTTWTNDPGTEVKSVWSAVVSYYQGVFSDSYSGETWTITCDWKPLSGPIAQGGPTGGALGSLVASQPGAITGRIQNNVYYASALANHLAKTTLLTGENLDVTFNSGTNWDFSISSKASDKESFYATAIHEVAHGLGFISADVATGGWSSSTGPKVFDYYLGLGSSSPTPLIEMSDAALAAAFVSNNVYWTGANGIAGHGGTPVQIYAPSPTYQDGSSMSHLDFTVNPSTSLLMYPSDAASLPLAFSYSATELGIWKDMGYDIVPEPCTIWLLLLGAGIFWKAKRSPLLAGMAQRPACWFGRG